MPFTNTKESGLESLIVKWLVEQNGPTITKSMRLMKHACSGS